MPPRIIPTVKSTARKRGQGRTRKGCVPGLAERVIASRKARDLSRNQLAIEIDVAPSVLKRIEDGTTTPSAAVLLLLARKLSTTTDHLLTGAVPLGSRTIRRDELPSEWQELTISMDHEGLVIVVN